MIIANSDPGLSGAIFIMELDDITGTIISQEAIRMPIIKHEVKPAKKVFVRDNKGKKVFYKAGTKAGEPKMKQVSPAKYKTELDVHAIYSIFSTAHIINIELQNPRPGNSAMSSASTMKNYGKMLALAELSQAKLNTIAPSVWKKHFELNLNQLDRSKLTPTEYKKLSIQKAHQLSNINTTHDGIADAICIGHYWLQIIKEQIQ